MSFFNPSGKRPSIVPSGHGPVIRKVTRPVDKKPVVKAQSPASVNRSSSTSARNTTSPRPATDYARANEKTFRNSPQGRALKRKQPTPDVVLSSDSEGESNEDDAFDISRKRARPESSRASRAQSLHLRDIRDKTDYSKEDTRPFDFMHSIRLVSGKNSQDYRSAFSSPSSPPEIRLQYPGFPRKERFQLLYPQDSKEYRPLVDIIETATQVLSFYLPASISDPLLDELTGIPHSLKRAAHKVDLQGFTDAINRYNKIIEEHRVGGVISSTLDGKDTIPFDLTERILSQVYERIVSPEADTLRKYESFSDSTYGEILPRFASQIFQEAKLTPTSVFLDLGSGVGSVVLQAALECGCESIGIEFEEIPAKLAALQMAEFSARARLWGLSTGSVRLMKGDFFSDNRLSKILSRADVILVNNQAFSSLTNDKLVSLFLDVKEGARIVSLKSFVPSGFEVEQRTAGDMRATLSVKKLEYWTGYVSWKAEGGDYYIATKDMTQLREFYKRDKNAAMRASRRM